MVLVLLHGQPETIAYVEPGVFDAGSNGYWESAIRAAFMTRVSFPEPDPYAPHFVQGS